MHVKLREVTAAKKVAEASLVEWQGKSKDREEKLIMEKTLIEKQMKLAQVQFEQAKQANVIGKLNDIVLCCNGPIHLFLLVHPLIFIMHEF